MTSREKLIELLTGYSIDTKNDVEYVVDHLIENGAIVPPDELYTIVDKGTRWANVMPVVIEHLSLFEIKNPMKYGYYFTKEEAEKASKESERNLGRYWCAECKRYFFSFFPSWWCPECREIMFGKESEKNDT